MEIFFLLLLVGLLIVSLSSGYPVAFAIPGSAIIAIGFASLGGYLYAGNPDVFFVHGGGPSSWLSAGVLNFRGIYRSDESDIFIAIPLFIFMGLMLQRSKVAEDLLLAMAQLFGGIRGGLGISVVLVGGLLAAATGIVGATVIAMGMISLPTMLKNRYSKPLATGIVAATGTLGQIIPPSIVLLILVQQLTTAVNRASSERRELYKDASGELVMPNEFDVFSVSAGDMFIGAFVPGLILIIFYMLYIIANAYFKPDLAPAIPLGSRESNNLVLKALLALGPPLILIILVLGSIVAGVATVNQAGAIGAAGATIMAGYRLRKGYRWAVIPASIAFSALVAIGIITSVFDVNLRRIETNSDVIGIMLAAIVTAILIMAIFWSAWHTLKTDHTLKRVVEETTKTTSLVFAILLGAVMLTAAFRGFGGDDIVRDFLQNIPGGFWGQFTVVMLLIFALGFFLDFIEITVVVVPIVAPILLADPSANITAVWLGVMIALNIQTSFLTPPFGFALFYLRGVAPVSVKTIDIYKGVVPFIIIQLLVMVIVGAYPMVVNYFPNRVVLLSDSSPPTRTPRLQYCLEEYTARRFQENKEIIGKAIANVKQLNIEKLPIALRNSFAQSLLKAENSFLLMVDVEDAKQEVSKAAVNYRPLLTMVRELEKDANRISKEIDKLELLISRSGKIVPIDSAKQAEQKISILIAKREKIYERIPSNWDSIKSEFSILQKSEYKTRLAYRRNADDVYGPILKLLEPIHDVELLNTIEADLHSLRPLIGHKPISDTLQQLEMVRSVLRKIAGTSEIQKALSKAHRALRANPPLEAAALESLAKALEQFYFETKWRKEAKANLLPQLEVYEEAIRDTIGLRGQSRLPKKVAARIAQCSAKHRDIFLNF